MKVCFTASSGGHLVEISQLKELTEKFNSFLVTEYCENEGIGFCDKVYFLNQVNRKELFFVPKFIKMFWRSYKILKKENPDIIISTGALMTYPFCVLGKVLGKKIVYIESFARTQNGSLTGRLVYPFADVFIVQWKKLKKVYPKSIYLGGIF